MIAAPAHGPLFAAISLPSAVQEALAPFLERLRAMAPGASHPSPSDLHLTLRYWGPGGIAPRQAAETVARVASKQQVFPLALGGLGSFGSPTQLRVLWLDVRIGAEQVAHLAAALGGEPRLFVPHVTLAKARHRAGDRDLAALRVSADAPVSPPFLVTQLEVWRRVHGERPGQYESLGEFPLRS
ncbi:MAG: RNA 2',3'-cyclic phosphodiesterase [Myxococcota bacterium]